MFREQFGAYLAGSPTRWLEPPWKAILSNKGILPLLWAMFPRHPNLLPAFFDDDPKAAELGNSFVRKPLYSREGANVAIVVDGAAVDQDEGPYGAEGYVRQAVATSAALRRQLRRARLLDRGRQALRALGARGFEPDHQEHLAIPAPRHRRVSHSRTAQQTGRKSCMGLASP